jgi:hypothetical protein
MIKISHIESFLLLLFFFAVVSMAGCTQDPAEIPGDGIREKRSRLTQELNNKLLGVQGKGIYFGMQDATGYGVGWKNNNDSSDIKKVTGDYPAFAGWGADYSPCRIARGEGFDDARYKIRLFHKMGGFNTMEWHAQNPYGGNYMWENHPDKSKNVVAAILPDGEKHQEFLEQLDNLASFFNSLIDDNGEKIPVIFRPWHEHTGDWFWWGQAHCSKEEYIILWKFTVNYLREEKQVNNLLFAYSPGRFTDEEQYLERYPGDEYIDILGLDNYWDLRHVSYFASLINTESFISQLEILVDIANRKNKPAALTETGPLDENGSAAMPENDWYTAKLLQCILRNDTTRKISYAMVWRNDNPNHFHVPYPGHPAVSDFIEFYENPYTIFMSDISNE